MRGNLVVPEGVEVIWGEPAILGQIDCETPLLSAPPTHPKSDYQIKEEKSFFSLPSFFKKAPTPKFISPDAAKPFHGKRKDETRQALVCKPRKGVEAISLAVHPECAALEPGTQVFVRYHYQFNDEVNPNAFEVSLVAQPNSKTEPQRTDMPELNRDMRSSGIHGYVFREDVTNSHHAREFTIQMEGDIFDDHADIEDVRQAVFGNCFLLAAVASILNRPNGYEYFQSIIKQEDEKTSVVKLYDFRQKKFVYVRVHNTIFCENNDNTLQHKKLWIHILEKAFVGLGIVKADRITVTETFPSYREIYGKGGNIADAYLALTGHAAEEIYINNLTSSQSDRITSDMTTLLMSDITKNADKYPDWESVAAKLYLLHGGVPAKPGLSEETLHDNAYAEHMTATHIMHFTACFETLDNFKQFSQFWQQRRQLSPDIQKELSAKMTALDNRRNAATITQMTSFAGLCLQASLSPDIYEKMLNYAKSPLPNNTYPYVGPLGSGMYTAYHLAIYDLIEKNIREGNIISTCTNELEEGAKHMVGLRTPHAYTILGVMKKEDNGVMLHYVQLRNTWGYMGREYYADNHHQMLAREKNDRGNFNLELSDFVKAMHSITISQVPQFEKSLQNESKRLSL